MINAIIVPNQESPLTGITVYRKDGKVSGTKFSFVGQLSAKSIKEELADTGLKSTALSKAVRDVLTGEKDVAAIKAAAFAQACLQKGLVPIEGRLNAKGNRASVTYEMPKAVKAPVESKSKLAAMEATIAELTAKLAALTAPAAQ